MKNHMKNHNYILIPILLLSFLTLISTAYSTLYYFQGYDNEKLTVTTSVVVQFTQAKLNPRGSRRTDRVFCSVETNGIRYWYNEGVAGSPTSSTGISVSAGKSFEIMGYENINSFGMISRSGTAIVNVQYETLRTLK